MRNFVLLLVCVMSFSVVLAQTKDDLIGTWQVKQANYNTLLLDGSKEQTEKSIAMEIAMYDALFVFTDSVMSFTSNGKEYDISDARWGYEVDKMQINVIVQDDFIMNFRIDKMPSDKWIFYMLDGPYTIMKFDVIKLK